MHRHSQRVLVLVSMLLLAAPGRTVAQELAGFVGITGSAAAPGSYQLGSGVQDIALGVDVGGDQLVATGTFYLPDTYLYVSGSLSLNLTGIDPSESVFHHIHGTMEGTLVGARVDTARESLHFQATF